MRSNVFVRVRDCACPDSPHAEEGDGVYLTPTLNAEGGILAEQIMGEYHEDLTTLTPKLMIVWTRYGAVDWNFLDAEGVPIPFDVEDLLADWAIARPVTLRATELYQPSSFAPFLQAPARPSRNGQTRATTSRRRSPTPASSG